MRILKIVITASICLLLTNAYTQKAASLNDAEIVERINFIEHELNDEHFYATSWTGGWTIFNGGSAAYFYYAAAKTDNKADQVNKMVIGVGSAIAFIGNIVSPMVSMYAPYFLEDMPETTRDEKNAKLAKAEKYLKDGASLEIFGQSWISQSINIATASAGAFVVGVVYKKRMKEYGKNPLKEAALMFAQCFISGELQILTQPMRLVSSQKKYNQKYASNEDNPGQEAVFFFYPVFDEGRGLTAGVLTKF